MSRKALEFPEGIVDCINATRSGGTIIVAGDMGSHNGMTIGWISIGSVWGRPVCVVLVRHSRHTYGFMENGDSFTVNMMSSEHKPAVDLFGSRSGRDMDKFEAAGITAEQGTAVASPYIAEADYVIECKTAFKSPMDPELISADYVKDCYPSGDYHTCYYGEILAIHKK
jgi:flavin reductase (DIM6/NTAB) family NADH-FMN oxidoreductase RutF